MVVGFLLAAALCFLDFAAGAGTKEAEVANLITKADDDIVGAALIDLYACHGEVEHTRTTVLCLHGEVVKEGDVGTNQWRERLVDANRRHVPTQ